ncbi:nicotinamide phosphoribosyltransferase [Chitinophaga costaii]|uniref:Nicotinamide phosphoribosyltransferase n=1 Tax=Chitinophaga costaii TaxID=1335309 RepID=A0A1C3ZWQ8_9BACT|nr:nicotinate phosphoribosyltransferase [Chitinophaga costaii]PUZ30534.1 nicotinate phosphoribosyltransferase [Chitinophaga costaii]SCB86741.1 nicotinamide phosphoribosyltransferase [Chitinophaga costaii]
MYTDNIILMADAYKYSHHKLYYPGTNKIYSYLESRGGLFGETAFFGLQYILKKYFTGAVITKEGVDQAATLLDGVFGSKGIFDRSKFDYIIEKHGGRLPVRIKAVKEGSILPVRNVLMTIENTDPQCYWLTNFLETILMQTWYPSSVATLSYHIRQIVEQYFAATASATSLGGTPFILNDFGFRGTSSGESAGIGGMSHLLNFKGSDTVIAAVYAQKFYNASSVVAASVPATEHSIMTLLGEEGELEVLRHILKACPTGIVSVVSDSFDIFRATSEYWGGVLKEEILARNGTLVIRPDSGDPVQTLLHVFDILMDKFGYTVNEKGYKVLPPQVRVIQGDGINLDSIRTIYKALQDHGISAENLVLGMGGALLQRLDRDSQQFAIKCSYAEINGQPVNVQKHPLEMNEKGEMVKSFKTSKSGRQQLVLTPQGYKTIPETEASPYPNELETVFENGELLRDEKFEAIQERIISYLKKYNG